MIRNGASSQDIAQPKPSQAKPSQARSHHQFKPRARVVLPSSVDQLACVEGRQPFNRQTHAFHLIWRGISKNVHVVVSAQCWSTVFEEGTRIERPKSYSSADEKNQVFEDCTSPLMVAKALTEVTGMMQS